MNKEARICVLSDSVHTQRSSGDRTIIQLKNGTVVGLNETSTFIYTNCNGKTVGIVAQELYDACINKEELSIDAIIADCQQAVGKMETQGLISFLGKGGY